MSVAVAFLVHDDIEFFEAAAESFRGAGELFAFVSRVSWNADQGDYKATIALAEKLRLTVIEGDWTDEGIHRREAYALLKERGFTHCLIPDTDEVIEPELLTALLKLAESDLADRVYVQNDTYWKSPEFVIRPRERRTPMLFLNLHTVEHTYLREFSGGRALVLGEEYGILHHMSYAGSDSRIRRKVGTWSHKDELVPNWYSKVWKGWDMDPMSNNLHPTHPEAYGWAERIPVPEILASTFKAAEPVSIEADLSKMSIVIPVYGAAEELTECLQTLAPFASLLKEVIVVDNASLDNAREVAKSFPFVTLIENEANLGFAKASNQGYACAAGDYVLFLNSDAFMPEVALRALIRSLETSGSIAAVGPYSNNVGHFQATRITYTHLDRLGLYADLFASLGQDDIEIDMLVGFCLLVRQSVLSEVGAFDERFGLGMFEDNDLCYRIRRAGYKMLISGTSFVHHVGSKTIHNAIPQPQRLLEENSRKFNHKWQEDLQTGFVNCLPGTSSERIVFNPARKPEKLREQIVKLAKKARISLCMIVKNEERVIDACLKSAIPFFYETIIIDTGSTDETIAIARSHGAQVYEHPWENSFSVARNQSLSYATGDWIFWLDADDTLPLASGEAILQAALQAPSDVHGFVVPVQFLDEGENSGTRVDHVKLFRNYPGLKFSLHIHEQILPALNEHPGRIARCEAVVYHSGYDTSEDGQKRKRERDSQLLALDLADNPEHPFVLFNLGMTAHFTGEHEQAIQWLTDSIAKATGAESHLRKAYALKGVSVREAISPEAAIPVFVAGLERVGWDPELYFHLGMTHSMLGNTEAAIQAYETIFAEETTGFYSSYDVAIVGHKTLFNLASLYAQIGNYPRAKELWLQSLASSAGFTPSAFALFDAALACGDNKAARDATQHVRSVEGISTNYLSMTEKFLLATDGVPAALRALETAVAECQHRDDAHLYLVKFMLNHDLEHLAEPRLRHLASRNIPDASYFLGIFHLRRGQSELAKAHFERVLELQPGHEDSLKHLLQL
ncbi:MAG: glycosyltransferase [Armatimonadetes bacterium]|nr:glycosyltransferase [Armatimonadota bacterium]